VTWPVDAGTQPPTNGTAPNITTSAANTNGVNLGSGNTLRGFNLGDVTGSALRGSGFGTLTTSQVGINGNGQALNLNNGTLSGSFPVLKSTGGTNNVYLSEVATSGTSILGTSSDALSGATGDAFVVAGGTGSFTYSGNVTKGAGGATVKVSDGHSGTLTFQTGTVRATGGTGLQFDNADGSYAFNGTTTLNGGNAGIDVINGSSGTFTFASGASITNLASELVLIDRSAPSFTYAGTLSKSAAQTAIGIYRNTGGTVAFTGPSNVFSTQTAPAVALLNNTGTRVSFTGSLQITTGIGTGLNAVNGGTLTVAGTQNSITSSGGVALNVASTTIGAGGLNFRSISADGGSNGIVLNNTGTGAGDGSLTIEGTGSGACTSAATCTGGTIQNSTGAGILLNQTRAADLNRILVQSNTGDGIDAERVPGGLTLADSTVTGNGNDNVGGDRTQEDRGLDFLNVSGPVNVLRSKIEKSTDTNAYIHNTTSAAATLTVTSSTITDARNAGMRLIGEGASNVTANITQSTFSKNDDPGFSMQTNAGNTARQTLVFDNNDVSGGSSTAVPARPQISINSDGGLSSTSQVKVTISNNRIKSAAGNEITLNTLANAGPSATFDAKVVNNQIGDGQPGTLDPVADGGVGIHGWAHGDGIARMEIRNNAVQNFGGKALELGHNNGNGSADYTVSNNTLSNGDQTNNRFEGIYAYSGGASGDQSNVCIDMDNNDMDGSATRASRTCRSIASTGRSSASPAIILLT
jgi:hypothetical protein